MGEWSNLTQREKSNIIRFAIKNGVSDINQIRDTFNVYAKDSLANVDYNMAAAKAPGFDSNGNGHYPDTFKKPNHPTFSDESIYHSEATPGGHWSEKNSLQRWNFSPSAQQISQPGYIQKAIDYLNNSESEGVTLTDSQGRYPSINGTIYGGVLPEVTVTPQYKEGGKIYIKPSKRGTFTAAAKKHGKSVQEFARQVLANKENYSPAMVRKANFARNSAGWEHSTGGPLYLFSFSKNPYWKTPVVRYAEGGDTNRELEFIPNENIQNVEVWLNKGTRFQKQRSGTVNLQNIVEALNPNGPDNQYVWDNAEHTSYSAFRRNPDYRAPIIPSIRGEIQALPTAKAPIPQINVSLPKPNVTYGFTKRLIQNNWIPVDSMWNPAYGYETFHLENSPYYGIKYYSIPGAANAGQGSSAVLDSTVMGIPIQELNERIFNYRTNNGGWSSFSSPN